MLEPLPGHDETELRRLTSIAGRGYHADWHLFMTAPALLMVVSIIACLWRDQGSVLATLVALNAVCALAAVLGLLRVAKTLNRLKIGRDDPELGLE
jgi:hypothetical protein